MTLQLDYDWQRAFLPSVKEVLAQYLITEAPWEEDAKRNTDLIVLEARAVRVACRLRRSTYLSRYGDEFTIRSGRPSGTETELAKVLRGFGDYLFYGFADEGGFELSAWVLGDLGEFRLWHHRELVRCKGEQPGSGQVNGDGSSSFRAYRIEQLPPAFVVARKAA